MTTEENRMKSWRESQAKSGKKRMDVFLTEDEHEILKSTRLETEESYGDIIGKLLVGPSHSPNKPGYRQVILEIPERFYDRLMAEYTDLKGYLEMMAMDKAKSLLAGDQGDF